MQCMLFEDLQLHNTYIKTTPPHLYLQIHPQD